MTVSIKDIARVAHVSPSTVSRALANSSRVKPDTRIQIQHLASEMGYFPSQVARSLVMQRTRTIGLIATTITDLFQAEVIQFVEQTALKHSYSVILAHSGSESERELAELQVLRERRVDGIILVSARADPTCVSALRGVGMPIILINNVRNDEYVGSVRVDNRGGSRQATEHLLELGHRRIAYISGPSTEWDNVERQKGYEQALLSYGLSPDPALIAPGDSRPRGGMESMEKLLALSHPPTAVFCYNDASALGALRAAHAAGLRVPQDLSVVGFDNIDLAAHFEPPLTTIAQPMQDMGQKAVEMILDLLAGAQAPEDCVLPGHLIVRESTMPPLP